MGQIEPQEPIAAPPGWYPQPDGRVLWWNGSRWNEPPRHGGSDLGKSMAVLPHLGLFALPVIAALAVRLTLGEKDPFVKHHATEALNAQIWFAILWNGLGLSIFVFFLGSGEWHQGFFVAWGVTIVGLFVLASAMAIRGAVMAYRQAWWRYPLVPYRFVRGASSGPAREPAVR